MSHDTVQKLLSIPARAGLYPEVRRPSRERPMPHQQLSQNAPQEMQDALFSLGASLEGVYTGQSLVSLPGARAFFLYPSYANGPEEAFQAGTEFAHIHIPEDGSFHVTLPERLANVVIDRNWGEYHPVSRGLLIFGPRDPEELNVAWEILQASYAFARGDVT